MRPPLSDDETVAGDDDLAANVDRFRTAEKMDV
jgi:hypothetical protein